ncbi:MAG: ComEA family DNA-binding protein [Trueperaceae bacterium]
MAEKTELLLTVVLAAACVAAALLTMLPRLAVQRVPITFEAPDISVAVDGEVAKPGVYRLPFRARVVDALELAGGMTDGAEASLVDLAASLGPGERVHVPSRHGDNGTERISVNSAVAAELELLPGVGPVTAGRIVAGRPYSRLEDLLRVKGIGEKTLERLREHARL